MFSFVSGLYFRGKLAYARRFASPPDPGDPVAAGGVLVITPNAGLRAADTLVTLAVAHARSRNVDIAVANQAYRQPLERAAHALLAAVGADCDVVLLGSIASGKYVEVLQPIFGDRLVFPPSFVGRGDMSRGGLMLRCVTAGEELEYAPVAGAVRHGQRPPRLQPLSAPVERRHARRRPRRRNRSASIEGPAMARLATRIEIPTDAVNVALDIDGREVRLTNLRKPFWPERGITKGALLQYYADVAPLLLPHIARSRDGDEALSERRRRRVLLHEARADAAARRGSAPAPSTTARATSSISRSSTTCRRCSGWSTSAASTSTSGTRAATTSIGPDYLHFDLDPGDGATFDQVRESGADRARGARRRWA